MSKTKSLLLAVAAAAMAFTISCTDDGGDGGGEGVSSSGGSVGGKSSGGGGKSSSSVGGSGASSSSSVRVSSSSSGVQCLEVENGTFIDDRDGKEYKYVTICSQIWMAENLNYEAEGSKCYGEGGNVYYRKGNVSIDTTLSNEEIQANCDMYGRLYDWETAMALPGCFYNDDCSDQIQPEHRGICPSGWHIPTGDEWRTLSNYVQNDSGCSNCDAKLLKATSGWNSYNSASGNGEDAYGFAALPGGGYATSVYFEGGFSNVGDYGYWWITSIIGSNNGFRWYMTYSSGKASLVDTPKKRTSSIRCVKDN